jgi:hypothetical protein
MIWKYVHVEDFVPGPYSFCLLWDPDYNFNADPGIQQDMNTDPSRIIVPDPYSFYEVWDPA